MYPCAHFTNACIDIVWCACSHTRCACLLHESMYTNSYVCMYMALLERLRGWTCLCFGFWTMFCMYLCTHKRLSTLPEYFLVWVRACMRQVHGFTREGKHASIPFFCVSCVSVCVCVCVCVYAGPRIEAECAKKCAKTLSRFVLVRVSCIHMRILNGIYMPSQ